MFTVLSDGSVLFSFEGHDGDGTKSREEVIEELKVVQEHQLTRQSSKRNLPWR